ncbi:MAG: TetR/AcrR family transcriptional regulator, partial [Bradyrhizobium sp.]|nr:TetR/AcrR family transcriptional regulator [Bradyrhizobium sp.]
GFENISVGALMKAAGFTHGGFYNHFESKSALAGEALAHAFHEMERVRETMPGREAFVKSYMSDAARDAPGATCPAASLAGDIARQPDAIKEVFAEGIERMIDWMQNASSATPMAREEAVDLICRMVGALMLARAMPASSDLRRELLATETQQCLIDLPKSAGEPRRRPKSP